MRCSGMDKLRMVDIRMMTSSNGNISALRAICARNSPVNGEFPTQRPMTRRFDVFFDLPPNERLSKQSGGWCFETPSRPLWRHSNKELWSNAEVIHWGAHLLIRFNFNPNMDEDHIHSKAYYVISYPFNDYIVTVWQWITNFIPDFYNGCGCLSMLWLNS